MVRFALAMDISQLRAKIRDIKDFPTEGILYKDITTLLQDGPAWASVIDIPITPPKVWRILHDKGVV